MPELLLGVDIGTSSVVCSIFDVNSHSFLASASEEQRIVLRHPGWAEQDPEDWWTLVRHNIQRVLREASVAGSEIAAIGVSGQMQAAIPLDKEGNLLSHMVQLWCDKRCASLCEEWVARLDTARTKKLSGNDIASSLTAFKIKWLEENRPEEHRQTHTYLWPKDYINLRLTGVRSTDYSDASGSFLMDARTKRWSEEMCDALKIDISLLPPIRVSSDVIGKIMRKAAFETGLSEATVVVAGGADFPSGLLAAGVTTPGSVGEVCGSSSVLAAPTEKPIVAEEIRNYCHVVDRWIACSEIDTAGESLRWFGDLFSSKEQEALSFQEMEQEAAATPPGAEGLLFLPYLLGERTMGKAANRGAFLGISLSHTRGHFIRAIMEGVCLGLRPTLDTFEKEGISVKEVHTLGGGSRSRLWGQIRADIYGRPVSRLCESEGSILGVVLLAGVGAGFWSDPAVKAEEMIKIRGCSEPNSDLFEMYNELEEVFQEAYCKLKMLKAGTCGQ